MSTESPTEAPARRNARYHTTHTAGARMEVSPETIKKWCQDPEKRAILGAFKLEGEWKIPYQRFEARAERAEATGSFF